MSVTSLCGNNSTCVGCSLFLGHLLICHCIPSPLVHLEMNLTLCLGVFQRQGGNSEYVCRSSSDRAGVYLGTWVVCFAEEGRPVCTGQLGKVLSHGEQAGCTPRKCAVGALQRQTPEVACGRGLGGEGCPQTHSKMLSWPCGWGQRKTHIVIGDTSQMVWSSLPLLQTKKWGWATCPQILLLNIVIYLAVAGGWYGEEEAHENWNSNTIKVQAASVEGVRKSAVWQHPMGQSPCCSLSPHPGHQPCLGRSLIPSYLKVREARWPVLGPTGRERHPFYPLSK